MSHLDKSPIKTITPLRYLLRLGKFQNGFLIILCIVVRESQIVKGTGIVFIRTFLRIVFYCNAGKGVVVYVDEVLVKGHRMKQGMMGTKTLALEKRAVHGVQYSQGAVRTFHYVGFYIIKAALSFCIDA